MDELIERVARAIWEQRVWQANPDTTAADAARLMALAAIGAMMADEPRTDNTAQEQPKADAAAIGNRRA